MKMKHLKTFENFSDMGRFSEESDEFINNVENIEDNQEGEEEMESGCCPVHAEYDEECPDCCGEEESEEDFENEPMRNWGDQVIEKKKNPFAKFQKEKKDAAKGKKEVKKDDKKEVKGGLTASQKKLPAGLQKAILAKKK